VTGPLAPLAHSWVADTPHESPGSSQTHPSIPPTSAPAFSFVASNRSLLFAKTTQDIESCPRNDVTGGSACYSFQTHFEFWRGTNLLSLFPHVPRSPIGITCPAESRCLPQNRKRGKATGRDSINATISMCMEFLVGTSPMKS